MISARKPSINMQYPNRVLMKNARYVNRGEDSMCHRMIIPVIALIIALAVPGCGGRGDRVVDPREKEADKKVREMYGKSLAELPTVRLVAISPHNTDIEKEYEAAFSLYHAVKYGQKVDMEWRDVGGGSSAILKHLQNVYENSDRSGIDIVWGGGEYNYQVMAREGILHEMEMGRDVLENIPSNLGGIEMYSPEKRWCGSAVSGFGFLYNKSLLERLKLKPPEQWEDLGDQRFYDIIGLADPMQSGSAAASYEMIVQSGGDWATGWAKLLAILGNTKKFYAGSGDAAEALPSGEVAIATCIDFYGIVRVAKYPDTLKYISPRGQTSFNPDPIGILKNPPSPLLAQRFVDFVLSQKGQALWALPVGHPDGPVWAILGRQPIRKDVYERYGKELLPQIVNPYAGGQSMKLDVDLWSLSYGILRQMVWTAAVENLDGLRAAKRRLIETGFEANRLKEFNRLPENIATRQKVAETLRLLGDKKQLDIILTDWVTFFRDKYKRVAE